ncbi:MAG: efflux RND transporter periplasmic adaptor subunit [Chelatococcus sp.]|nr:efflux RND transporter periplasmic adaptor subunit [Chelatococcus sp. YT9]MBX3556120.1 efflux RND transporter periplasmic adaptor subunit [Chelatococcus sp.]
MAALFGTPALVNSAHAEPPSDAPMVGVASVHARDVAPTTELIGRIEAINAVDILSRVSGFVRARQFTEGGVVTKGQELYTIEADAYEIALSEARAALQTAEAARLDAERQLQRNRTLIGRQAVAQSALELSETAFDTARANVMSQEARVRQAELNLSYTTIRSPLNGRIGVSAFSEGSLVGPSSGALARVVQTDPIRVVFSVSDRTLLDLREKTDGLSKEQLGKRFSVRLRLSNASDYDLPGHVDFFNNEVDPQTGTLAIRAQFANPQSLLVPGQFVTVVVRETEPLQRPVVPLGAVQQDREGKFALVVDDGNHVAMRRIRVSRQLEGKWVVDDGLSEGDKVIVEGLQNAAPGAIVKAIPVDQETTQSGRGESGPAQ